MRHNTASVVDLAAIRRQRVRVQPRPMLLPMMLVWVPVWFVVPFTAVQN
jgi:hypothetical protein